MKTDNLNRIKEKTGCTIGKLFELTNKGSCEEIECYRGNYDKEENARGSIYDEESGNLHLMPYDKAIMQRVEQEIGDRRVDLVNYLKEEDKKRREQKIGKEGDESGICIKINENTACQLEIRKGTRGNNVGLIKASNGYFQSEGNLFRYIRVTKDNRCYDINFMRFFTQEAVGNPSEKTINCILKCLQFSSEIAGWKCCYPKSSDNGTSKETMDRVYFNPKVSFYDSPKSIIKEFICFIDEISKE